MLNWADLCSLLMVIAGPTGGFLAAHSYKAGMAMTALFVVGGLIVGYLIAAISHKLTNSILRTKRLGDVPMLFLSMLIPFVALLVVMFIPVLLAAIIYG